jgi:hypothetical protein
MRSAFFAFAAGLIAVGCTAETHGTGPSGLGSGGDATAPGGGTSSGGSSATGGSSMTGAGGGAAGSGAMPGATCGKVWYNGESSPGDVNLAEVKAWTDPSKDPAQGTSMVSESTNNPHGGTTSLEVDLNWATDYYGGAFGINFAKYDKANAYDVHDEADLEFWIRTESGDKTHVVVWLTDSNGTGSNRIDITSSALVTPQWRKVSIPLTQFTGVDLTSIWEVDADTHSDPFGVAGGVKFFVDDGAFTTPACP